MPQANRQTLSLKKKKDGSKFIFVCVGGKINMLVSLERPAMTSSLDFSFFFFFLLSCIYSDI